MAQRTVLRETAGDMVRIGGLPELRRVAGDACSGKPDEDPARVTTATAQRRMRSGQAECRLGVIENGAQPVGRAVAEGAVRRQTRSYVVRIGGLLESREMAPRASRWRAGEIAGRVALRTLDGSMRSHQRKNGLGMVETCARALTCALCISWDSHGSSEKRGGVVAVLTGCGIIQRPVVRIRSAVVIRQVAGDTRGARKVKHAVRVTARAAQRGVRPREGKARKLQMIEMHCNPAIHGVALLAVGREAKRNVGRAGGFLKIRAMAREAVRG